MESWLKMTMKLISTITTTGSQQFIDFTNITQNFTDLLFVASLRNSSSANEEIYITINGSGGAGTAMNNIYLYGNGSSVIGATAGNAAALWQVLYQNGQQTANTFGNLSLRIPNYSLTGNKVFSTASYSENNATAAQQRAIAQRLNLTPAVTSVQFISASNPFSANSTISLYGILKGSGGATVS
jgi:hypothetical protein